MLKKVKKLIEKGKNCKRARRGREREGERAMGLSPTFEEQLLTWLTKSFHALPLTVQ